MDRNPSTPWVLEATKVTIIKEMIGWFDQKDPIVLKTLDFEIAKASERCGIDTLSSAKSIGRTSQTMGKGVKKLEKNSWSEVNGCKEAKKNTSHKSQGTPSLSHRLFQNDVEVPFLITKRIQY